jgi:hypothetical protein
MAVVAVGLVGFSQGRRHEREQLPVERERLAREEERLAREEEKLIEWGKDFARMRALQEESIRAQKRRNGSRMWMRGDDSPPSFLD